MRLRDASTDRIAALPSYRKIAAFSLIRSVAIGLVEVLVLEEIGGRHVSRQDELRKSNTAVTSLSIRTAHCSQTGRLSFQTPFCQTRYLPNLSKVRELRSRMESNYEKRMSRKG